MLVRKSHWWFDFSSCPLYSTYLSKLEKLLMMIKRTFHFVADSYLYDNNLAMGKAAGQSSDFHPTYTADRAVDGSWNMLWDLPLPCTHTHANLNAWWSVDLEASYPIVEVWISNRYHYGTQH